MPVPNPWRSPSDQAYLDQWLQQWKARQPRGYVPKPGWEDRVLQERRQTYAAQGAASPPAQPPARPDTGQRVPAPTPSPQPLLQNPQTFGPFSLGGQQLKPQTFGPVRPQPSFNYAPAPTAGVRPQMNPQPQRPRPIAQQPITQQPMPPRMAPSGGFRSLAPGTVPADQWMGGGREMELAMQVQVPQSSPAPMNQLGQGIAQAMTSMAPPQRVIYQDMQPQSGPITQLPRRAPAPTAGVRPQMNPDRPPQRPVPAGPITQQPMNLRPANDKFAEDKRQNLLGFGQPQTSQPFALRRLY